jgi:hypothetical protein
MFQAVDEPEVDCVGDEVVDNDRVVVTVSVELQCPECSTTMREGELEIELPIEHKCPELEEGAEVTIEQFEVVETDASGYVEKRRGVKYYGAEVTAKVMCVKCEEEFEISDRIDDREDGFEEAY